MAIRCRTEMMPVVEGEFDELYQLIPCRHDTGNGGRHRYVDRCSLWEKANQW